MQLIRKIYEMIPDVDALKTRVDAVQTHREIPPWQVYMTLKMRGDAAADKFYCLLALV